MNGPALPVERSCTPLPVQLLLLGPGLSGCFLGLLPPFWEPRPGSTRECAHNAGGMGPCVLSTLEMAHEQAEGLGVELDPEGKDALAKGLHLLISRCLRGGGVGADRL